MTDPTAASGSTGAGQQDPGDSVSEFSVFRFRMQQILAQLDVMKLVKVVKVTGGGIEGPGTVDVELLVNQIDGSDNASSSGTVYGLPWLRLQGGKNAVICDPKADDIGFVVCADRDISGVKSKKGVANPGSRRKFSVSDGVYIGGILNGAPEQYILFSDDSIKVVDKTGNVLEMTSTGIELTPSGVLPVKVNGNLVVTGNFQLGGTIQSLPGALYTGAFQTSGDITAKAGTGGSVTLSTHRHTQPNDNHGDTEQPTAAPTGGT